MGFSARGKLLVLLRNIDVPWIKTEDKTYRHRNWWVMKVNAFVGKQI